MPTESQFINNMEELGVNNKNHIILYSHDGIGTSPRAWWLFKLFGHKNISILNGGLIAWLNINGENSITIPKVLKSTYIAKINKKLLATNSDIIDSLNKNEHQIVDARSIGRFKGTEEEPRAGLQKGHIPNSINIPFNFFLKNGYFLKEEQILDILNSNNFNFNKNIISTCGSGVTACVLAFALELIGKNNWQVYDGSWSEWGSNKKNLIET